MEMEMEKEIISENDDPMTSSAELKHLSEVLLTILASDSNTEIVAESDNPDNSLPGSPALSNSGLTQKINGISSPVPLSSLYYSPTLRKYKKGKKLSSSSGSLLGISKNETIEYSDDWGATYSSGILTRRNNTSESYCPYPRPEKQLIDFALRLVILDKTLSGIHILLFIWATVVLLGGFASMLKSIDFWFVAAIIFIIGTGIFSRNHQLESRFFFQAAKAISGKIGIIITLLQFLFASMSITFSIMRLVKQGYSEYVGQRNMTTALNIFYTVALTHSLLYLIEKAYWFWTVSHLKIIEKVRDECGFGTSGVVSLRRFFHETYWKLTKGSVFHALDLDLITFAQGLLVSNSQGDQLIAVRILNGLISHDKYSQDTCHSILTSTETIDRLINMLSWHDHGEEAIRIFVAKIVSSLASKLHIKDIPEAMDCISSLLEQDDDFNRKTLPEMNSLGLKILINLASNPMNCLKITKNSVVLSKIVHFTKLHRNTLNVDGKVKFTMVKRSLTLLEKIVSTNGKEGQILRRDVSQISSIVNNLRDILIYGSSTEYVLLRLVIKILTALSMDEAAQKKIGSTDGITRRLLSIFINYHKLCSKAGDALVMLTLSNVICSVTLKENADIVQKLIVILNREDHESTTAMKILRNMCAYSGIEWHANLKQVNTALPLVNFLSVIQFTSLHRWFGRSLSINQVRSDSARQ
jgi:hypothetical protein